jgi:hypothetical protein
MPSSAQSLLIALFIFVPGFLGERIYRQVIGESRRELGYLFFVWLAVSVVSLLVYTLVVSLSEQVSWLPDLARPGYFSSAWMENLDYVRPGTPTGIDPDAWYRGLAGHVVVALSLGALAGFAARRWPVLGINYQYASTWDHAMSTLPQGRFVLVELTNGVVYHASVYIVNRLGEDNDRDLVLREPRVYDRTTGQLRADSTMFLYLPGGDVRRIAFLETAGDQRLTPAGWSSDAQKS